MAKTRIAALICLLGVACSSLQAAGPDSATAPDVFAKGVVSAPGTVGTTFTPDGRTVYFARLDRALKRWVILRSQEQDGAWATPSPVEFSRSAHDGGPSLSPDGRILFFWSLRPTGDVTPKESRLWVAERVGDAWGEPRDLGAPVNAAGRPSANASVSVNGNLYFVTKREDALGWDDIYLARRSADGAYERIENLGAAVNSPQHEFDVYVAPDETYILFSSNRPGGHGKADIYISRKVDGAWSAPRNLGPLVNSPGTELAPAVSPDGRSLFFSRIDGGSPGIYRVDAASLGVPQRNTRR
jgi:Tol biopolymer transport system component